MHSNRASISTKLQIYFLTRSLLVIHVVQFCSWFSQVFLYAYIISFIPGHRGLSGRLVDVCAPVNYPVLSRLLSAENNCTLKVSTSLIFTFL